MKLLEVKNVRKSFDDLEVLKDISLDVSEGQVVSILGPSGSGKSTFLRCLSMLETVDGGSISYCGKPAVTDAKYVGKAALKEIKSYFSLVFQSFNLFPHYTVMKNICDAPVHVMKRDKEEVRKDGEVLLKKMGLDSKADHYPYQLSGGQQQRVAIARALNMKPKMLFFDEPTSALDPELTAEILKVLKELAEEKMTMVIVTHEIAFARSISDHVVFMDGGVIVEQGAPADVIDNPSNDRTRAFLKKLEQ
ncbi:amino acid ABC transporter ATP-binding protein [Ruminococcus sp.]|uniref:amino acid ABC transporter ATP-binding protein n=1 Tax=Ruminococcus sp. TaxID=41978 RepID=UPI0025FFE4AE|nr:amino acid ABC transporter ATP-binding protein [Ruminococcus sp.]MBQ8965530.1 amino acid ABC transporter ATP-binding protein [Ruminococcus sp.]